jgi:starch-binding outer membrane protein, SusD/RagB family
MKIVSIIAITAITSVSLFSCKKYQDNGPLEYLVERDVFDSTDKNGTLAQQFLNDIYANMPTGFNRIDGNLLDAATDDAMPSQNGTTVDNIAYARISSAVSHPDGAWSKNYTGIRKVNMFLNKIDIVPKPSDVPFWKAEARFLRAFFYFELVKRYGGVPLVGDTVFNYTDDIQLKRNTFAECVDYIVAECDSIKGKVKAEALSASDWGRISRGAVLALKSRVLLYAASPLFNGGVAAGASAEQKALMGYPTFSAERWQKAAQAALDIMNLSGAPYSLETAYNNVFLNRRTKETILSYLRGTTSDVETNNGPVGFFNLASGNGRTSPTQELVDAFPMLNGKAITDNTSGYVETTPYVNRDPRLALTVLYNGVQWLNRPIETFEGGLDKPNGNSVQTRTGYYMRKFMGSFATATQYSAQNHNFVIFRFAETMLNYAEAQNEFAGPSAAVYKVLTDLRKRAGLTAGTNTLYGLKASMTKDEMREAIQTERRIEMAFEEQRYWDVRRWKIAGQVFNKNLTGLKITKTGTNTFTYQRVVAGKIVFVDPKMYLYPISFTETSKNSNLIQNFGW